MNLPIAPLFALALGVAAAAGVAAMPTAMLEGLVMDSGLPAILPAAEPPLGMTARLAVAAGAGGLTAVFMWFAVFLMVGTRSLAIGGRDAGDDAVDHVPSVRRADAHPDAPPRPPLRANRDLGTPFLDVRAPGSPAPLPMSPPRDAPTARPEPSIAAPPEPGPAPVPVVELTQKVPPPPERALPADLDQPLAAFDPDAIPAAPVPAPVPFPPLRRRSPRRPAVFETGERFETFELTPPVRPARPAPRAQPMTAPETEASIQALLDRLEQGAVRRGLPGTTGRREGQERGLEDALVTLRNLARPA